MPNKLSVLIVIDNYGHDVGDLILKRVAERINAIKRAQDTAARFGGDEFVLLLPKITSSQDASLFAKKLREKVAEPYVMGENSLSLGASIGIAIYPEQGKTLEQLIQTADAAMYLDKSKDKSIATTEQKKPAI